MIKYTNPNKEKINVFVKCELSEELEQKVIKLEIEIQCSTITQSSNGRQKRADDSALQRKLIEVEKSHMESRL